MISEVDLSNNFSGVVSVGYGVVRCEDELPNRTYYYYFKPCTSPGVESDLVVISENRVDDKFAHAVLAGGRGTGTERLEKRSLGESDYNFSSLILAPPAFHMELKGRMDAQRSALVLCVPAYNSEFSGNESVEEFLTLRREVVPTMNWRRTAHPKILLRFDNPMTGGGTGDGYVLAKYDLLQREIDNLNGSPAGFIEVINYKRAVLEILFQGDGKFAVIENRNDANGRLVAKDGLIELLWRFLTE